MSPTAVPRGQLDLLLLAALAHGPTHAYALIASIRTRSDGHFELLEGSVYPALQRLEDFGLVTSGWVSAANRRRRVYELTPRGVTALAEQREQWRSLTAAMDNVIGWST